MDLDIIAISVFADISLIDPKNNISQIGFRQHPKNNISDEKVANWIHILIRQRTKFAAQVEEIDEILEMKVTHRKNLTRREKKFG